MYLNYRIKFNEKISPTVYMCPSNGIVASTASGTYASLDEPVICIRHTVPVGRAAESRDPHILSRFGRAG